MKTEKRKDFLIHFGYFAVIILGSVIGLKYAMPALAPFFIALIIAYFLKKPIGFLQEKCRIPEKPAAILTVLLFYVVIGLVVALAGIKALSGLERLFRELPQLYGTHIQPMALYVLEAVEKWLREMDVSFVASLEEMGSQMISSLGQMVSDLSVKAMGAASGFAAALPGLFIDLVVLIISTFFIAADYPRMRDFCLRQLGEKATAVTMQIKEYVIGTLFVCIRSYILIMSITFVELAIGLSLIKIPHAVLIALLTAVFDILPVLGTGGVMIPWMVIAAVQGNLPRALGLLVIYLIITVIRNIIEPKIVGKQLGLHPVVTLACMFLGLHLFGGLGLFGLPIGLSLLCYLNDHDVIKVFR